MDVGLALPHYDHSVPGERPLRWTTVVAWARAAEAAGLGSVWVSDHLFASLQGREGQPRMEEGFEPLATLAGLARATTTVGLGTLVLCPHLRPPGVLAKALAGVDVLSRGRLTVGLGGGWFEPEHQAAGVEVPPAPARLELLAETIEVLHRAFTGEPFDFEGRHLSLEGMICRPPPHQRPGPPVWVGGSGDRLLDIAARHADGWNAGGWSGTLEGYASRVVALELACEDAGRDPGTITRSVNRLALIGEDERDLLRRWERLTSRSPPGGGPRLTLDQLRRSGLVGTAEQVGEQMVAWSELGVTTMIVSLGALPFTVTEVDDLDLLASASRQR